MILNLSALFLNAFVAATILPMASEVMLWAIVTNNPTIMWPAIIAASAGNIAGSTINWILGRYVSTFGEKKWYPLSITRQKQAKSWFQRFGKWSLLFAWLPIVGDPLTLVAGLLRVRFPIFLILVSIGKIGRYTIIAIATYVI